MHPLGKRKSFIEVDPQRPTKRQLERIYSDDALLSHKNPPSSTSQPSLVVQMLEALRIRPGNRVLEIGAGTGWNAALMAHLAGPRGHVVTIEIQAHVARAARHHLKRLAIENATVVTGDGAKGYTKGAPYDRLITTVTCPEVFPSWWEQLAREWAFWAGIEEWRREWMRRDLAFFARLQGFDVAPLMRPGQGRDPIKGNFVLSTSGAEGTCLIGEQHLTAYGSTDCFHRFKKVKATWLSMGAPSRAQYRVEVWPKVAQRRREKNTWNLHLGAMEFTFSLK
jgi:protein-L-isoaspartate(D-aspartate) O-methyltransferase